MKSGRPAWRNAMKCKGCARGQNKSLLWRGSIVVIFSASNAAQCVYSWFLPVRYAFACHLDPVAAPASDDFLKHQAKHTFSTFQIGLTISIYFLPSSLDCRYYLLEAKYPHKCHRLTAGPVRPLSSSCPSPYCVLLCIHRDVCSPLIPSLPFLVRVPNPDGA